MNDTTTTTTLVDVPGQMFARYEDGQIAEFVFMPHASNAGYFGPAAVVMSDDKCEHCGYAIASTQADESGRELLPEIWYHVEGNATSCYQAAVNRGEDVTYGLEYSQTVAAPIALDVESVDGPFWRAVQGAIGSGGQMTSETILVRWSE